MEEGPDMASPLFRLKYTPGGHVSEPGEERELDGSVCNKGRVCGVREGYVVCSTLLLLFYVKLKNDRNHPP